MPPRARYAPYALTFLAAAAVTYGSRQGQRAVGGRQIFIGDVHGMNLELQALLRKLQWDDLA